VQRAGVPADRIYVDKMPGKRDDHPGLAALLDYAREGDTVVVIALDRLGRSLSGIIRTLDELQRRGVMLRSLREGIDYSTAVGQMVAGIFAALAQYEHALTSERADAAREAARARTKQTARPRSLTPDQVRQARRLREAGESIADIQATLGCARSTLYRALSEPTGSAS
jgi:DNA invertase Pin-like site-specific DNA recombinase